MSDKIVRLKWPGPEAFSSPEALARALANQGESVERLLAEQSRMPKPSLSGSLGRLAGRVLGRVVGKGPYLGGPSGGGGGGGWLGDLAELESTDRVEDWSREGVTTWEVRANTAAVEALEESGADLLRVDRDRGFAYPVPQPGEGADATAESPKRQLERLGIDSAARSKVRGKGVRVAVLDSGLDAEHAEFSALDLDREASFSWYRPQAPQAGKFAAIPVSGNSYATRHYHGTAVAGLVVGGASGVAPEATLLVHNVFYKRPKKEVDKLGWTDKHGVEHRPDATLKSIEGALMYATSTRSDVVVLSLGTQGYDSIFEEEIGLIRKYNTGTLLVAAAGNSGQGTHLSPGDYRDVLTVGAVDLDGAHWKGTSGAALDRGGTYVKPDIYAPGVDLSLPVPAAVDASGYLRQSGTSFAGPIVAGVAALVMAWYREQGKTISASEVRDHLLQTADDFSVPPEWGGTAKRLNAARAVAALTTSA